MFKLDKNRPDPTAEYVRTTFQIYQEFTMARIQRRKWWKMIGGLFFLVPNWYLPVVIELCPLR